MTVTGRLPPGMVSSSVTYEIVLFKVELIFDPDPTIYILVVQCTFDNQTH